MVNLPMTHQVNVHRSCVCNELIALHNRHLLDRKTETYDPEYMRAGIVAAKRDFITYMDGTMPCTYWDVIKHYRGAKRAMYVRALDEIKVIGFQKQWARIKMFVKPDKYDAEKVLDKAPRAIQFRRPPFNLKLATFLKPIEERFYEYAPESNGFRHIIAKGKNNEQRAQDLVDMSSDFEHPVYLLLDHCKFDSSVTIEHLRMLAKIYLAILPYKTLKMLLRLQIHNKGRTQGGIAYSIDGTKMSGELSLIHI